MANVKISELALAGSATATQQFEVNDSFLSKKVTGAMLAAYILAGKAATAGTADTANALNSANSYNVTGLAVTNTINGAINGSSGYSRQVPTSTNTTGTLVASDAGKCLNVTVAQTVPPNVFAIGDIVSIYNGSAGAISIVAGAGLTLRQAAVSDGTKTLASTGLVTIWFASPTVAIISGAGLS